MTVRFVYSIGMPDVRLYRTLATAVEAAGWDAISVPDSICYPQESSSTYPYTDDGSRAFLENKPFIDPFSLLAFLAACTSRIELVVAVLKLPVRHPVLVAKQVASVAALSGDRLVLGVGSSPWPDDYEVCGVPWEGRGERMDEALEIVRRLTGGGYVEHHGARYDFPAIKLEPVPARPVPILVGGHSQAALRRAAAADGWISAGGDDDDLRRHLTTLTRLRVEAGRADAPWRVVTRSPRAATADGVRRLADLGVTDVVVRFQNTYTTARDDDSLATRLEALERYGRDVIAEVRR